MIFIGVTFQTHKHLQIQQSSSNRTLFIILEKQAPLKPVFFLQKRVRLKFSTYFFTVCPRFYRISSINICQKWYIVLLNGDCCTYKCPVIWNQNKMRNEPTGNTKVSMITASHIEKYFFEKKTNIFLNVLPVGAQRPVALQFLAHQIVVIKSTVYHAFTRL